MAYGVIYLITNTINGKKYVGQTTRSVEERFKQHAFADSYIGNAIRAHGADMFVIAILKVCYSKEELDKWERHMIRSCDTKFPNGYNLTDGGEGLSGWSHTEKSKAKIGLKHKGKNVLAETRTKLKAANMGKKQSNKTKSKRAMKNRGESPYKNLVAEMDKRNFTYSSLAELLGFSFQTFSAKMRCLCNFTAKDIAKLVEIFELPAEYLFQRYDAGSCTELSTSYCQETPFKNLIREMYERKLSYKKLANLLGLSKATFSAKMHNRLKFTAKDIAKLVEIFRKPAEYLMIRDDAGVCTKLFVVNRHKTPYKNLLNEIETHQFTYVSLAKLVGLSRANFSDKMRGVYKFTAKDIAKLVEIFGKPAEYLMSRAAD